MTFDQWLAGYLQQDAVQVEHLLKDSTVTRFLIAWSLFESNCFDGFLKVSTFEKFSEKFVTTPGFSKENFLEAVAHFHIRYYKDSKHYKRLMHGQTSFAMSVILDKKLVELRESDMIFMLVFVVYRFRNNIFHGNKGVASWLEYEEQINWCLTVMQSLISLSSFKNNKELA